MKARTLRPGLSRAILYLFLAVALVSAAVATSAVQAASTIAFRSAATANNHAGGTLLNLPKPTGTTSGDVLVAQVVVHLSGTSIMAPSGWSLIRSTTAGTVLKMSTYYRVAGASEPSSYQWTFSSSVPATGGISRWTGVDTKNPVDVSSGRANSGSTAAFAQVTTTVAYDMLLAFVGVARNTTVTPPYHFTERYDRHDAYTNAGKTAEMSQKVKAVAGLTGIRSAKEDTVSVPNITQLVALRPGAGSPAAPTPTATAAPLVIAASGDMECQTANCQGVGVVGLISNLSPAAVFPVGDLVWIGSYSNFTSYYDPSWGRFNSIAHPAIGNHDGNAGYFTYWGSRAGPAGKGWYSFSRNGWHFVVLNSNCIGSTPQVSCAPGSEQINWLASDLAAHPTLCTIAFMHIPYYTSGPAQFPGLKTIFQTLYNNGVDLLVTGHTHYYQRFYPQDADGNRVSNGVAEFVVGTGGGTLANVSSSPTAPNEAAQIAHAYGALRLTLNSSGYSFRFIPAPGSSGSDSGSASCH